MGDMVETKPFVVVLQSFDDVFIHVGTYEDANTAVANATSRLNGVCPGCVRCLAVSEGTKIPEFEPKWPAWVSSYEKRGA